MTEYLSFGELAPLLEAESGGNERHDGRMVLLEGQSTPDSAVFQQQPVRSSNDQSFVIGRFVQGFAHTERIVVQQSTMDLIKTNKFSILTV